MEGQHCLCPVLVLRAVLLSCFLPPREMAAVGLEQLGSLVSAGMVLSPCLFQGRARNIKISIVEV